MKREPIETRFWRKVDKTPGHGPQGECWVWTASTTADGYGEIGNGKGGLVRAHRLSWELHFGPIPADRLVRHSCDNPPCVNPGHLLLGTNKDNKQDSIERGRIALGSEVNKGHLTEEDVKFMRHLYWAERKTLRELGEYFGVCGQHVHRIVHRKRWSWL